MRKTKEQVRDELKLDRVPDDEFMQLLETVGEGPVVAGAGAEMAQEYTPEQIEQEVEAAIVKGRVGNLLAQARADSGLSLRHVGEEAGVSRGRIQQLEQSENVELATLVRVAAALGYGVQISLTPKESGKRQLTTELAAVHA